MESKILPEDMVAAESPNVNGDKPKDACSVVSDVTSPLQNGDCEKGMMELPEEEEDDPIPDGGWGWVVCAGSFMVNFIIDGTMFSFGILLLELLEDLGETKAITSWVGSAQLGMSMMMGPLVSMLLKKFSVRQVAIAGTLVSTAGFLASVFAPNVYVLIVMYGVVGGTGFCMTFLPSIIVVGLYFSKKRAIATGIATSGSGVGTFVYAYICDMLLDHFTWRQTVLILTGLMLNCLACGMVFRPLVPSPRPKRKQKCCGGNASSSSSEYSESEAGETTAMMRDGVDMGGGGGKMSAGDLAMLARSDTGLNDVVKKSKEQKIKDAQLAAFLLTSPQMRHSRHKHHRRHHRHHRGESLLGHHVDLPSPAVVAQTQISMPPTLVPIDRLSRSVDNITRHSVVPVSDKLLYFSETQLAPESMTRQDTARSHIAMGLHRPILRKDIYYSGSVSHLAAYKVHRGSMASFLAHMVKTDDSSVTSSDAVVRVGRRERWRRRMERVFHLNLFRNNAFIFLLVVFVMWTVQAVPVTYLPNMAVSKGIRRKDAAFLISVVGITNTAARIVAGIVTDVLRVPSIWLYVGALLLAAGVNFAFPWCDSFPLLASAAAVFGVCMAVAVSMRTIVLTEQLGIDVLTQSFGVVALFQGLAFTVNPPIAGRLFDETGAYFWPFTMAALMYLISGICSLVVAIWFRPLRRSPRSSILAVEEVETESSNVSPSSGSTKSDTADSSVI